MTNITLGQAIEIINILEKEFEYRCKQKLCKDCPLRNTECNVDDYIEYVINEETTVL